MVLNKEDTERMVRCILAGADDVPRSSISRKRCAVAQGESECIYFFLTILFWRKYLIICSAFSPETNK